jgi:hypothetical protein
VNMAEQLALPNSALPAWDLDACMQALVDARTSQLVQALTQAGTGLYVLIDPMLGDPVLPEPPSESMPMAALNALRSQAWERHTFALSLPSKLSMDGAFAPYLVELQNAGDAWLQTSVQWAVQETWQSWQAEADQPTPHRVGGWLQSSVQGEALAHAMSGWLHLNAPSAGRASYLRLADRRVLSLAVHVLGQACVAQAMRPVVQQWLWLDPHAALQTLSAAATPVDDQTATQTSIPAPPIAAQALARFSQGQWAQMALGPQVHSAMAQSMGQRLPQRQVQVQPVPPDLAKWPAVSASQWQAAMREAEGHHRPTQTMQGKQP